MKRKKREPGQRVRKSTVVCWTFKESCPDYTNQYLTFGIRSPTNQGKTSQTPSGKKISVSCCEDTEEERFKPSSTTGFVSEDDTFLSSIIDCLLQKVKGFRQK
jgi:hypothetical protein